MPRPDIKVGDKVWIAYTLQKHIVDSEVIEVLDAKQKLNFEGYDHVLNSIDFLYTVRLLSDSPYILQRKGCTIGFTYPIVSPHYEIPFLSKEEAVNYLTEKLDRVITNHLDEVKVLCAERMALLNQLKM